MSATIKDVAKYTGLSIATISKYINGGNVIDKNKLLIDEAIKVLGFKVNEFARSLKTNKTKTIGVLIPSLKNTFITTIVSYIEDILLQNGYSTLVCDYNQNRDLEKMKLEFLISKLVDGIIIMPLGLDDTMVQKLIEKSIPLVLIDRMIEGAESDTVVVDNINASYTAIEYLITKGHRDIGIICGPQDIYTAKERLLGYKRVHEDYHLSINEAFIKIGNYELESGYLLLKEFLTQEQRPTAIFVTNYEMTLGAIMAINDSNVKVPEELSIIGFDNMQLAKVVKPNLTIVVQPLKQIGEYVASIILKRLNNNESSKPSIYRMKTELIEGSSVKQL